MPQHVVIFNENFMFTNKKINILCFAESLIKIILIFCTFLFYQISILDLNFFHYSIIWVHQEKYSHVF